ncbi:MAG: hypothetical protein FWD98_00180 [Defluviitaleaceae bacterium]|nr:hypothetical protein [Defluviitaleaceae bacterium]
MKHVIRTALRAVVLAVLMFAAFIAVATLTPVGVGADYDEVRGIFGLVAAFGVLFVYFIAAEYVKDLRRDGIKHHITGIGIGLKLMLPPFAAMPAAGALPFGEAVSGTIIAAAASSWIGTMLYVFACKFGRTGEPFAPRYAAKIAAVCAAFGGAANLLAVLAFGAAGWSYTAGTAPIFGIIAGMVCLMRLFPQAYRDFAEIGKDGRGLDV